MAVIVRRMTKDPLGGIAEEKIYMSVRHPISNADKEQAEIFDEFLRAKMNEIYQDLEKRGRIKEQGDLY